MSLSSLLPISGIKLPTFAPRYIRLLTFNTMFIFRFDELFRLWFHWIWDLASKCKKCLEVSGFGQHMRSQPPSPKEILQSQPKSFLTGRNFFMIVCGRGGFSDGWDAAAQVDILPSSPKKLWLYHYEDLNMFYLYLCVWDLRSSRRRDSLRRDKKVHSFTLYRRSMLLL